MFVLVLLSINAILFIFILLLLILLYKDNGRFRRLLVRARNYRKKAGFLKTAERAFCFVMKKVRQWRRRSFVNVAFKIGGGFGDFLFFANYLYYFKKKFSRKKIKVDVCFYSGIGNAKHLFKRNDICRECFSPQEFPNERMYDLCIELSRYQKLVNVNAERLTKKAPELLEYVSLVKQFERENPRYFSRGASCDGQSAMQSLYGCRKRLQQPDIYGYFGIKEEYSYPLFITGSESAFLKKFDLQPKHFVTMHRGCDPQYPTHVKMWPLEYYGRLAEMIKKEFPSIVIVEYGVSHERCPHIDNVDLDIVGQTSMDEVKILLKNSLLHIDSDGGMVHLRHALHGGTSIAMYGPNYGDFFGYSENINVTGNGCTHYCDWLTENWMVRCARGYKEPPCMTSISPESIMDLFRNFMKQETGIKR